MPIEGPLRELGIHDVFQLLDLSRKTGTLRVSSDLRRNEGKVFLEGGAVVHASMVSNPHQLGSLLRRAGKVTEQDIARADEMQKGGDKRKLGEILVANGATSRRDVERYMRMQIEAVIFELLSWSEGFFSFSESGAAGTATDGAIRVSTESLLMEGARRIDEWSRMADRIPGAHVVPRFAPLRDDGDSKIDLLPGEWEVLATIDGVRDLLSIAGVLAISEFDVAKIVYGMLSTGLIELSGMEGARVA